MPLASLVNHGSQEIELAPGQVLRVEAANAFPLIVKWPVAVLDRVTSVYAVLLPILALLGLAGVLGVLVLALGRRRLPGPLAAAAAILWTLVVARVAILVLVDVTSFPAVNLLYMQGILPLSVLATIASAGALIDAVGVRGRSEPDPAPAAPDPAPAVPDPASADGKAAP